jgi:sulfatase maturation enzyme AslB (radical SAM superfamily)
MAKNINLVMEFAKMAQVSNVIFTSKGEPTLNMEGIEYFAKYFVGKFPLELQTNGILLNNVYDKLYEFNVIAISIDNLKDIEKINFKQLKKLNKIIRLAICINDSMTTDVERIINFILKVGMVDQISFRYLTTPIGSEESKEAIWIKENTKYSKIFFDRLGTYLHKEGFFLRNLPYGAKLFDVNGLGITWFDYCIQEHSNEDDIRSLIFQEDGHLYTHWGKKGSIIF